VSLDHSAVDGSTDVSEAPPPILRTWRRLYTVVLLALAVEVGLFYALTRVLS